MLVQSIQFHPSGQKLAAGTCGAPFNKPTQGKRHAALDDRSRIASLSSLFPSRTQSSMSQQHRKYVKRARRKRYLRRQKAAAHAFKAKK
ncbi:MAG TPA: hypothetical protein VGA56_18310 [Opitutaceae bacterium]